MNNLKDIKQINTNDSSMTLGEILLDALCHYLNVQENSSLIPSDLFDLEAKIDSILTNELKGGDQVMCFLIVFFFHNSMYAYWLLVMFLLPWNLNTYRLYLDSR